MLRFAHKVLLASCLVASGCVKEYSNQPIANIPPKTFLWLFPDSSVAEGVSKQRVHWWAEDPDGFVVGYLFGTQLAGAPMTDPDGLAYTWLTKTDSLVHFPLTTAKESFLVVVRGVDNTFGGLPEGAAVRLAPRPFWDKNRNGALDDGDVDLPALKQAMDPEGARQIFPIRNSPPSVTFLSDPLDPASTLQQPETTYTVASFSWVGSDPDGDETIASYRIALNSPDSTHWMTVSSSITLVTLIVPRSRSDNATGGVTADVYSGTFPNMRMIGTVPGLKLDDRNTFYIQARDVAGDFSPRAQLPTGTRMWFVKKPRSRLLVINDYEKSDSLAVRSIYRSIFASVAAGALANYDELNIRIGSTTSKPGVFVPTILNPQFVHTLKLYDFVLWYTDQFPSLSVAQFPLFLYTATGGRVIYTTEFASAIGDPRGSLVDFAPLDSISSVDLGASRSLPSLGDTRVPAGYVLQPDSSLTSNIYPVLSLNSTPVNHLFFLRPIYRRADARVIYRLQADQRSPIRYVGRPDLAVIDNAKKFVFIGVPLHILNGAENGGKGLVTFLNHVFLQEFEL